MRPKGVIFSGGPASVTEEGSPRAPQAVLDANVPILAICYGQQTLALQLGGKVEGGHAREFGRADVEIKEPSRLYEGVWEIGGRYPVWMSHGDRVTELPDGLQGRGDLAQRAVRHRGGRDARALHDDVPPRGRAHARWRQAAGQLRAQHRRAEVRLDDVGLSQRA